MTEKYLETEVWYRLELSNKGQNDWFTMTDRTYDSMIACKSAMDHHIANVRDTHEIDYRIIRVTTETHEVSYD